MFSGNWETVFFSKDFCISISVTRPSEQKSAQLILNIAQYGAHSYEKSRNLSIFWELY